MGNVDLLPTLLALAGADAPADVDGRDMSPQLLAASSPVEGDGGGEGGGGAPWRDTWLLEYKSVGTYYNDHASIWWPGGANESFAGEGYELAGPREMGGALSYADDEASNSWRALRVLNASMNLVYVEFDIDASSRWDFANVTFVEVFDLDADPMQATNLATTMGSATLAALHDQLDAWQRCQGATCL